MVTVEQLITVSWDHIMRHENKAYVKSEILRTPEGGFTFYTLDPATNNRIPCHWEQKDNTAGTENDRIAFTKGLILNCIQCLDDLLEDMRDKH